MVRSALSNDAKETLALAVYDKFKGSTFAEKIPLLKAVVAFSSMLHEGKYEPGLTLKEGYIA